MLSPGGLATTLWSLMRWRHHGVEMLGLQKHGNSPLRWLAAMGILVSVASAGAQGGLTARQAAAQVESGYVCEVMARKMAENDADRGWAFLKGCIARDDYADLDGLVEGVWAPRFKGSKDNLSLLLQIMARRSHKLVEDIERIKDAGAPVRSMAEVLEGETYPKGERVIFRGNVTEILVSPETGMQEVVFEETVLVSATQLKEKSYQRYISRRGRYRKSDQEAYDLRSKTAAQAKRLTAENKRTYDRRTGSYVDSDYFEYPTERMVATVFNKPVKYFREDQTYLVLARLDRIAPRMDVDSTGAGPEQLPRVVIIKAFKK